MISKVSSNTRAIGIYFVLGTVQDAKILKDKVYDDETVYDQLQKSVTDINETLKSFKIKSKNQYTKLAQEEEMLSNHFFGC